MIDALFSQPTYLATKKLLDLTVLRANAIASNLAHVSTPNYKRLDVSPSFEAQLRQAVQDRDPALITSLQPELVPDPQATTNRRDGNNVQLETEMAQLFQNGFEHMVETQLLTGALLKLRLAITGRPQ
jgi:flagellar basal-body rod protein FlgB